MWTVNAEHIIAEKHYLHFQTLFIDEYHLPHNELNIHLNEQQFLKHKCKYLIQNRKNK